MKLASIGIIVTVLLSLSGCGVPTHVYTSILDYRPYTDEGLFISPNPYPEAHKTLGEIHIEVYPGTSKSQNFSTIANNGNKFQDPLYWSVRTNGKVKEIYENFEPQDLLELCVQEAVKLGANGVSNFHFESIYRYTRTGTIFDHYEINGLAIKFDETR